MAQPRRAGGSLIVDEIWQSVSLEERLELISKSHASGFLASCITLFIMGSIAYGLDKIWLLAVAVGFAFFTFPLFSSQTWRTGKPSLILAYLAVRTVARRYAYSFDLTNIDLILIYRGHMKPIIDSKEDEYQQQKDSTEFDSNFEEYTPVWIVLMRGGIIVMSERIGGAKLEFITPILHDTRIEEAEEGSLSPREAGSIIHGSGVNKGKSIILKTGYKGAQYVFTKKVEQLVLEAQKTQETIENLRKKEIEASKTQATKKIKK